MSHDALKRLGVFSVGDHVLHVGANDEEYATVIEIDRERAAPIKIRFDDVAWGGDHPRKGENVEQWAIADTLRHDPAMLREEAMRRLQSGVHLQTVVQAWAHNAGIAEREGDPLCGAIGGEMVRAEARVTCVTCRRLMEELPRC